MCGIAGIIRWAPPAARDGEIERMTEAVAHRGPDGHGVYVRDGVALGHRRLAIIDLKSGQQPMSNEDQTVWVTFNGEIYNFKELANDLKSHGHTFRTRCDTETIVHAYEQWGDQCVERFRGMFAFAVADFRRRRVLIARDHLGIKPLYYRRGDGYLGFASELGAIRKIDDAPPQGSLQSIDYYLAFKWVPNPDTIYQGVYKLPPASYAVVNFDGRFQEPRRYWDLRFKPKRGLSDRQWEERFDDTIRRSVQHHLVADVPFGVFLSGGVDSTLIAMHMSQLLNRPVKAFAIGFDEKAYSELPYAREAARALGVELEVEVIRPEVATLLPELIAHYGEPFADISSLPTWHVCRMARQHVPMVLSGDGGDEAFAGYGRYEGWMRQGPAADLWAMSNWPRQALSRMMLMWRRASAPAQARAMTWQQILSGYQTKQRVELWRPEYRYLTDIPCARFMNAARRAESFDRLAYVQYMDTQTYLPGDILTKVDVASMCHGLEVRTPFVDREVFEFAATLPMEQRRQSQARPPVLKPLAKRSLSGRFSQAFIHRDKMGFGVPQDQWLKPGMPVRALFQEAVLGSGCRVGQMLCPDSVRRHVQDFDAGGGNSYLLMSILVLGLWLECNRDVRF